MKIFLGYGYTSWTTGFYWEQALRSCIEVVYVGTDKENPHPDFQDIDIALKLAGASKEDVFIYIDSGTPYFPRNIEKLPCLTVCYLIDLHVDMAIRLEMSKFFDVVFVASKDYLKILKGRGFKNIWWIPVACEPTIHQRLDMPLKYEIGFVGHVSKDMVRRNRLLSLLAKRYLMNDYRRFYLPSETSIIYSSSKIVFNCSQKGSINMRVFEAMSCGRMLLSDAVSDGIEELFQDRCHLVLYHDEKQLFELTDYYLSKEEERESIAQRGYNLVRQEHTYEQRMRQVLGILKDIQKEKGFLMAPLRNASEASASISRCKIYAHWHLLSMFLKEWPKDSNVRSPLWKSYYLLRLVLSILKKRLKGF